MYQLRTDDQSDLTWFWTEADGELGNRSGMQSLQRKLEEGVINKGTAVAPDMMAPHLVRARQRQSRVYQTIERVRVMAGGSEYVEALRLAYGEIQSAELHRAMVRSLDARFGRTLRWDLLAQLLGRTPLIAKMKKRAEQKGVIFSLARAEGAVVRAARNEASALLETASRAYAKAAKERAAAEDALTEQRVRDSWERGRAAHV